MSESNIGPAVGISAFADQASLASAEIAERWKGDVRNMLLDQVNSNR